MTADTLTIAITVGIGVAGGVQRREGLRQRPHAGVPRPARRGRRRRRHASRSTRRRTRRRRPPSNGGSGSIGVSVASMRGEATINTTTRASVGDGSKIHALDADITASATNAPTASCHDDGRRPRSRTATSSRSRKDTSTVEAHIGADARHGQHRRPGRRGHHHRRRPDDRRQGVADVAGRRDRQRAVDLARRSASKTKTTAEATQTVRAYVGDRGSSKAENGGDTESRREREHAGRSRRGPASAARSASAAAAPR